MQIHDVKVKNFRLLQDVGITLSDVTTLIVGRNNSGKTSLTELFKRIFSEKTATFSLEDFSLAVHKDFWEAYKLFVGGSDEEAIRDKLPYIEVRITFEYFEEENIGPLGHFVIDLNHECKSAVAVVRYQLGDGKIKDFFSKYTPLEDGAEEVEQVSAFFKVLKNEISTFYKTVLFAEDPNDETNTRTLDWTRLRAVLQVGRIDAQRGLNDETLKETDMLGKILMALFATAMSESAKEEDRKIAEELQIAVQDSQIDLDKNLKGKLKELMPALSEFGYPGFKDPLLTTETVFDIQKLLSNHTKIRYEGINGINLPETFNGLGTRNLIFILLKLLEFFKEYQSSSSEPGACVVFIEEPEAHLHPQMQEVFIKKLTDIVALFAERFNEGVAWPVQFVVTTHSSHIANAAAFDCTRYFVALPHQIGDVTLFKTDIKDVGEGLKDQSPEWKDFLHKYMTLTRCDLFFADKIILIEGATERILLPLMIEKTDNSLPEDAKRLGNQYVSVVEVGGAYADKFYPLLDFLELRALVITDVDTVKNEGGRNHACLVSDGESTSNACIKDWFAGDEELTSELILGKSEGEKIKKERRIAYQFPTGTNTECGRSFEDEFMLKNPTLFDIDSLDREEMVTRAWEDAQNVKKTEFALKYAIEETEWSVPGYIEEGLKWLAEGVDTPVDVVETVVETNEDSEDEPVY